MHIMKGKQYMKHLRIENNKGEFLRGTEWILLPELTGDDVLSLAKAAVQEEDFDMDVYAENALPNPAHKVIYQNLYTQLEALHNRRVAFLDETRNIYQDAYDKYCIE